MISVKSRVTEFNVRIICLVILCITNNMPLTAIDRKTIRISKNITLADNAF